LFLENKLISHFLLIETPCRSPSAGLCPRISRSQADFDCVHDRFHSISRDYGLRIPRLCLGEVCLCRHCDFHPHFCVLLRNWAPCVQVVRSQLHSVLHSCIRDLLFAGSLVDRENYANQVVHGQGGTTSSTWCGLCGNGGETREVVMSHSNVGDSLEKETV